MTYINYQKRRWELNSHLFCVLFFCDLADLLQASWDMELHRHDINGGIQKGISWLVSRVAGAEVV